MIQAVREEARQVPVRGSYDVVVAGGGIAGVAAAIAAARNGASVCVLEKQSALGGLATLGNVIIWLPLCDGKGRQVIGGLGEELLRLSVADLSRDYPSARLRRVPACWEDGGDVQEREHTRFKAEFNPTSYLLVLEKLVSDEGVRVLYDTRVCAVLQAEGRITHVVIENKSGRSAIECRTVVDATGDADVCWLAGEQTESLDSNTVAGWFYTLCAGELKLNYHHRPFCPYGTREGGEGPFFSGDDAEEVTQQILETRRLLREKLEQLRAERPGEDVQVINTATIACFRMTRRLVGEFSLSERDVHTWFDDAIGLTGDWRKAGPVYAIPYRSLCGVRVRNLGVAGRCISVDTTVWDVTRAIPGCVVTGEAIGTAAALAAIGGDGSLHEVEIGGLQETLMGQGVLLESGLVAAG
jgi:glycine/D-amino acid oxidase-like deaminating enzyme